MLSLAMLLSSLCTPAIDNVSFSDVTIMPGGTGEVNVSYTASDEENLYTAFQIEMNLPNGINVVEAHLGDDVYDEAPDMMLVHNMDSSNGERCCVFLAFIPGSKIETLPLGEHTLFSFTVAADDNIALDDYAISVYCVEFTKIPINSVGSGYYEGVFLPKAMFNVDVDIIVDDEEDLHHFFNWLSKQEGDNLKRQLDLHDVEIPLTHQAETPVGSNLTITHGAFIADKEWNGKTVFTIPSNSTLSLDNMTIDFSNTALPTPLTLFDVAGTLRLGKGTNVLGNGSTMISPSSGKICLDGARLDGVDLLADKEVQLFSSASLAGTTSVRVPSDCLREGFRIMAPEDGYKFTLSDAFSVSIANDSKAWCVEVDSEGYLALFPAYLLGDVNVDGSVTVTDAVLVINHILGEKVKMREAAANIVRDLAITVSDVVSIIEIILK